MKKTIITLITILAACITMQAEEVADKTTRELTKKEQKAIEKRKKEIQDSIAHDDAVAAIENEVYILITDKTMSRKLNEEDRRLNFVIVEGNKILIQTGTATTYTGNNNLGGITLLADIVGEKKVEKKKNGEVKSEFRVIDEYLSGDVNVKLDKKGNYGEINILDIKSGKYVTYFGNFLPFTPDMAGSVIDIGKLYTAEGWDAFSIGKNRDVGVLMDYLTGAR